ncbi:hypothetical protein [Desulfocurvibacter africanus]|uniref:hypothetical protein n=1 Tax=Desulfocurvibacter africanus TaxID=873 RepID=UPI000485EACF|nr:hypothetical protein [Desulfocurvibacter africanus]
MVRGIPFALVAIFTAWPVPAWAVQPHGGAEGLYVHQLGHILFFAAVVKLWLLLRARFRAASRPWRRMRWSAALFALWNVVAFTSHFFEVQVATAVDRGQVPPVWSAPGDASLLSYLIYISSLDNLILVPAMLYFYLGLRGLLGERP